MKKETFFTLISQDALKRHPSCFIYFLTWLLCVIAFWVHALNPTDWVGAYTLMTFYVAIPLVSFIGATIFGWQKELGKNRWMLSFVFAAMYLAGICITFIFADLIGVLHTSIPISSVFFGGFLPEILGIAVGNAAREMMTKSLKIRRMNFKG